MSAWAWLNCKFDSAQPLLGASRSKLLATDKLGRHCVAPVPSLHFVCVLNCLAVIHCSVHPTKIISQSSNSTDTVLHFVWIKFLDKNFLYIRCNACPSPSSSETIRNTRSSQQQQPTMQQEMPCHQLPSCSMEVQETPKPDGTFGVIEFENPEVSNTQDKFWLALQNTVEVEFFGTRWGTGPTSVMRPERMEYSSVCLRPGCLTGGTLLGSDLMEREHRSEYVSLYDEGETECEDNTCVAGALGSDEHDGCLQDEASLSCVCGSTSVQDVGHLLSVIGTALGKAIQSRGGNTPKR